MVACLIRERSLGGLIQRDVAAFASGATRLVLVTALDLIRRWRGCALTAGLKAFRDANRHHLIYRGLLRGVTADDLAVILDRRPTIAALRLIGDEVRHQLV
jgi:hypothetical protein